MADCFTSCEFSIPADSLSLESELQQVFSSLLDSFHSSGRSQQCCSLDSLDSSSDFPFLQSFSQAFGDHSKNSTIGTTARLMFHSLLVLWQGPIICFSFYFLLFSFCVPSEQQNLPDSKFFFCFVNNHGSLVFWPSIDDLFISKSLRILSVSFCAYTI